MNQYDIYFEIYNHKLKTTITANSEAEAKRKVMDKLKFNKVVEYRQDTSSGKSVEDLKSFLGIK